MAETERQEAQAPAADGQAVLADARPLAAAIPVYRASMPFSPRYGALDLGTNNCRLLIARPDGSSFRVLDAFSRIVRLGEGLAQSGRLSEAAMDRTIEALAICRRKLDDRGAARARLVATEACRVASNGADFLRRVERETGLKIDILDRASEASLAAAGCAALADPAAESVVLFDIGGGSTELVWLAVRRAAHLPVARRIRAWASLPLGVVNLAERHGGYCVGRDEFEAMVGETCAALADFAARARGAKAAPDFHLLGTSGTVTTLGGIFLGLERYDRRLVDGLWMSDDEIDRVQAGVLAMSFEERAANGCIGRERADLVIAGCAILEAIRRTFPAKRIRIGDRGLREGLLTEMMLADGVLRGGRR